MKLDPELKQLRKDKRLAINIMAKQTEELEHYRIRIINLRQHYFDFFVKPIFETGLLTPREQKVLEIRFGFTNVECKSFEETAKMFDITRERIRQIEAKALEKINWIGRNVKLETKDDRPYIKT